MAESMNADQNIRLQAEDLYGELLKRCGMQSVLFTTPSELQKI